MNWFQTGELMCWMHCFCRTGKQTCKYVQCMTYSYNQCFWMKNSGTETESGVSSMESQHYVKLISYKYILTHNILPQCY